ncbi:hypothetical protein DFH08DRAFT_809174 [Mycena albidolilacea]|uniref:Ubiquitin-like domain-containing protein n=1 Tax=Mycena albidolilacea TaxID=1033008 RepID=A0AAD7A148_9AGAR|nr:hypothetical protein DFH08DRAFT_809174 [Mycena albidolilacea]
MESMVKIYIENTGQAACVGYLVDLAESVGQLKAEIEETEGLEFGRQRLLFQGRELSEYGQTLLSCSIQEHSTVQLSLRQPVGALGDSPWVLWGGKGGHSSFKGVQEVSGSHTSLYDWDGDMKHPTIKGLPLSRGMPVVVTDSPEGHKTGILSEDGRPDGWCYGRSEKDGGMTGWFPHARSASELPDSEAAPPLPVFSFPSAHPLWFKVPLGERGHSYVLIALTYERRAPPGQATLVDVRLQCVATSERCISSVSFKITVPAQTVRDVKYPEAVGFGHQTSVHVEVTRRETVERHGEVHFAAPQVPLGADAGASTESEQTRSESGTRESGMRITGVACSGGDTAHWLVDGARGVGEQDRVPAFMEGMSFVVEEKPAVFLYESYVTTSKDGKKKEHWGSSSTLVAKGKRWLRVKS